MRRGIALPFPLDVSNSLLRPLPSRLGTWGSIISSPSGVHGTAPAENGFWCILSSKNKSAHGEFDTFSFAGGQWCGCTDNRICTVSLPLALVIEFSSVQPALIIVTTSNKTTSKSNTGRRSERIVLIHATAVKCCQ